MKILQSSIFRSLCAIAVGIMLLYKSSETVEYITIATGILFFVSGILSCLGYYNSVKSYEETRYIDSEGRLHTSSRPVVPIVGVGSILLGLVLFLMPTTFVKWLMYILALVMVLGAINLLLTLLNTRKLFTMPLAYWVPPILVLLAGVYIFLHPMGVASTPILIIGIGMIVYGLAELVNSLAINHKRKQVMRNLPVGRDGEGEYIDYTEERD